MWSARPRASPITTGRRSRIRSWSFCSFARELCCLIDLLGFWGLARRQLVVRSEFLPFDGSECVLEQGFKKFLVDALAVRAVAHDQNAGFAILEADGVVSPAVVVALFEKRLAIRSPVQAPRQTVAETDRFVLFGGFAGQ